MADDNSPHGTSGCLMTVAPLHSEAQSDPFLLFERTSGETTVRATFTADCRLQVALLGPPSSGDRLLLESASCRLIIHEPTHVIVAITWSLPDSMEIHLNSKLVGSTKTPNDVPESLVVPLSDPGKATKRDFSEDTERAVSNRYQTLMGHMGNSPHPGRVRSSESYVRSALHTEVLQLRELLSAARQGAIHHTLGIAARLRLLIATGTPLPLLQHCAGLIKAPLVVYTDGQPDGLKVAEDGWDIWRGPNLSTVPHAYLNNPIDLDMWLNTHGARAFGRDYTHKDLIKKIGNTVGAHFDYDLPKEIIELRSLKSQFNITGSPQDLLIIYVLQIADVVLALSEAQEIGKP